MATPGILYWLKAATGDRKSTRLNSSHLGISYAVFCLKKKKNLAKRCLGCLRQTHHCRGIDLQNLILSTPLARAPLYDAPSKSANEALLSRTTVLQTAP